MAIKSVTKVFNERLTRDSSGVKLFVNYRVEFDTLDNDVGQCIDAVDPTTSLAVPGTGHTRTVTVDDDTVNLFIDSFEPTQQTPLVFNIACSYSERPEGSTTIDNPNANGNWDLTYSSHLVPVEIEVAEDASGQPIQNTAGEPYKGVKITKYDKEYTISWKTFAPPIATIDALIGCMNNTACSFTINGQTETFDPHTLRFTDADYSTSRNVGQLFWNVSVKLTKRPDTWKTKLIDEGTYYLDGSGNKVEAPTGGNVLLDGSSGQQAPAGTGPFTDDFWLVEATDFSSLFAGL